jgi:uncharacterized protein YutE (UPF0331/DUF86 family)
MKDRILEKLKRARICVEKVQENAPKTLEEFEKLGIVKDGIYKNLEDAIQNILDACALIVKNKNLGIPSDEESFSDLLYRNKLIDRKTKELIDSFRGLRNIMIHRYETVDDEIVFDNISQNLEDFYRVIEKLKKISD